MGGHGTLSVRIDRKAYRTSAGDGERLAIAGLEFQSPPGQFMCFVGPSGCGKTTMLNIVGGLDTDADAQIDIEGAGAEARVSYMFQTPRLLPWATVRDNVNLVLPPGESRAGRGEALLEQMELADSLDEFPNRLSGGMQRRVALARAFVTEPSLLLLDEPFVSLDGPVANRLRGILLDLWRARPTTVLFVTHDLREAIHLGDRIVFLSRGPSRIILDTAVPIPRPRDPEDPAIDRFRSELLTGNRSLLHGLAGEGESGDDGASARERRQAGGIG